jgi:hypothetical protein
MFLRKWPKTTCIVMTLTALAGLGTAALAQQANTNQLSKEAARMYAAVKKPHPGELQWQQIPWQTDLPEAVQQAKQEKRPILIFVSGDDPLEKC